VCGHEPGTAAVVLLGDASSPGDARPEETTPGRPRGRRAVIGLLAAVGVVAGVLAIVDAGADGGEAERSPSTTTEQPTTTRRDRRSRTTTTPPPLAPLVLGEQTGLRLVVFTGGRTLDIDLDGGAVTPLGAPGSNGWGMIAVAAGFVYVRGDNQAVFVPERAPPGDPIALGEAIQVVRSAEPDRVWLLPDRPPPGRAVEISLPSLAVTAEITLPPSAWVVDAVDGGLLVAAPDGAYVVDREGGTRRVSRGAPIAGRAHQVLEHRCDERLRCRLEVHDLRTDVTRPLPVPEAVAATVGMAAFSDDGRRLALVSYTTSDLFVFDLGPAVVVAAGPFPLSVGVVRWSPDGEWLFAVPNEPSDELLVLRARDGVTRRVSLGPAASPMQDLVVLGPAA
jgi:hypothetical protein